MMKTLLLACMAALTLFSPAAEEESPARCYELRIYTAAPGKLEALNARFRDHTRGIFTRLGMTNVAYWTTADQSLSQLIYLLSYPSLEARQASWKAFFDDPEWKTAAKASEKGGKLLARPPESYLLGLTDFSPQPMADATSHTFEMRTYTTTPGNLPALLKRFREHTMGLFTKHGMKHFAYFTPLPGKAGADNTLIYFLIHDSAEAQKKGFETFRADPLWVKAKSESESAAGGSLTVVDGVKSVMLEPTDFSPIR
jgi:NIPSNAP